MNSNNILVVEDDREINELLATILIRAGYHVRSAYSGTEAELCLAHYTYDLVLLDLMLPGMHGEELVKGIRKDHNMPIIIISAKIEQGDKIQLLKLGADDYITKPFDVNEVSARVEAQLRRYNQFSRNKEQERKLKFKDCVIDIESHKVMVNEDEIKLTAREYGLLELFMKYPKKVFSKGELFEKVWGSENFGDENTVNVHISHLRSKIGKVTGEEYIETVWGIGFKLKN